MNEEEKKAIERLEEQLNFWKKQNIKNSDCEIILNLITKLQKENEEKDNQIDLMAEKLAKAYHYKMNECSLKKKELNNIDCNKYKDCTSCIKQYFERKATNDG